MDDFTARLLPFRSALERYVRYRISPPDAEDVLQDVLISACQAFPTLRNPDRFWPWLLGIARNKCADCLRVRYRRSEVPLEHAGCIAVMPPRFAITQESAVQDTLETLSPKDQQILHLYYWQQLPQSEIARVLGIPPGTVKSRLHHARERFRAAYPHKPKGADIMRDNMPQILPDYTITLSPLPPFACKWEEMMGWFIIPRLGEKLTWAMYDFPERIRTEVDEMTVVGRALVHGVEGVEIQVQTWDPMSNNQTGDDDKYVQRSFVAQLTDTHCRTLSETHTQGGVKKLYTFLDGDEFLDNWGFGEDNCGNETNLRPKGLITRHGNTLTTTGAKDPMDVVGRYTVAINGKTYDTICVIMHETYMGGMVSEQFIDPNGRTVLWRRFNADDWHFDHYGRTWQEMLPDSETLTIDGKVYVHWYDCITSYIL